MKKEREKEKNNKETCDCKFQLADLMQIYTRITWWRKKKENN